MRRYNTPASARCSASPVSSRNTAKFVNTSVSKIIFKRNKKQQRFFKKFNYHEVMRECLRDKVVQRLSYRSTLIESSIFRLSLFTYKKIWIFFVLVRDVELRVTSNRHLPYSISNYYSTIIERRTISYCCF